MHSAHQIVVQLNVAPPPTPISNPSAEHKPILAERFKSKMCRNFEMTGVCPYESRCMFAHGEDDLRTKAMNLADNLVTEDAIKAFQRARYAPTEVYPAESGVSHYPNYHNDDVTYLTPALPSPCESEGRSTSTISPRVYRHDPYAKFSAWQPVMSYVEPLPCECRDCCRVPAWNTPVVKRAAGEPVRATILLP